MCAGPPPGPGAGGRAAPTAATLAGCGLGASARSRACTQYELRLYRVLFRPPEQCVLSKLECAWKLNQRDPRCVVWIVAVARDARLARALTYSLLEGLAGVRYRGHGGRGVLCLGCVQRRGASCGAWPLRRAAHRAPARRTGHRPGARIRRARRRRAYVCVRQLCMRCGVCARGAEEKKHAPGTTRRELLNQTQQPMKTVWRLPKHAPCDYLPFTPR